VRLVLDTNVVLSGLLWRSHPRHLRDLAKVGTVFLYTSSALLNELAGVPSREKWVAMLTAARQRRVGVVVKPIQFEFDP
jgi:predicted nucleic acid-binding protein